MTLKMTYKNKKIESLGKIEKYKLKKINQSNSYLSYHSSKIDFGRKIECIQQNSFPIILKKKNHLCGSVGEIDICVLQKNSYIKTA